MSATDGRRRLDAILSPDSAPSPHGPAAGLRIGVLALQGDFREHRLMLEGLGARTCEVRQPTDLRGLDGLVLPGGESTTISKLMASSGLDEAVRAFAAGGGVVYGTCAGLITVARATVEGAPPTLGLLDIVARRNAFGRQVRSFEADLPVAGVPGGDVHAVFIRAPWVESAGPAVDVLAVWEDRIVAARAGNVLVTAFHPELTGDSRIHELFVAMIRRAVSVAEGREPARRLVTCEAGSVGPPPADR